MEESEEYRDDDFDSSEGSATLAKVTVSASGKLPPLSGSYPYGADANSMSQSFQQSKDSTRKANQAVKKEAESRNDSQGIGSQQAFNSEGMALSGREVKPSQEPVGGPDGSRYLTQIIK